MLDSVNVVNMIHRRGAVDNTDANTTIQPLVFQWGCAVATYKDPQTGLDSIASIWFSLRTPVRHSLSDPRLSQMSPGKTLAGGFAFDRVASGTGFFYGYLHGWIYGWSGARVAKDDLITEDAGNQQYLDVGNSYVILGDPRSTSDCRRQPWR